GGARPARPAAWWGRCSGGSAHDEVREEAEFFDDLADVRVDTKMVEIARQIIAQAEGRFDPSEFRDRYEDALRALLAEKTKGVEPVHRPSASVQDSNVIDLMEALRRSLRAPPGSRPRAVETGPARDGREKDQGSKGRTTKDARPRAAAPREGGKHGEGKGAGSRRRAG
ncbi:MAG TPA: hypothetical protein VD970_18000, partial [Acetobacteraceae bacterium]|nr:hypothetical protein [Acetobacteraceae bacterium]